MEADLSPELGCVLVCLLWLWRDAQDTACTGAALCSDRPRPRGQQPKRSLCCCRSPRRSAQGRAGHCAPPPATVLGPTGRSQRGLCVLSKESPQGHLCFCLQSPEFGLGHELRAHPDKNFVKLSSQTTL